MTTGDQDPNAYGQPSGFPPPTGDPYAAPPGYSYPPPPGYAAPPPGYAPPPQPGFGPPPGYLPPPPAGYGYPTVTNPYGAPGGTFPGGPPVGFGQPGRLWPRWGARLIDGLLVGIVSWVVSGIFGASSNIMATGFFTGALMFVYFVAMEVTAGQTLGKKLLGMTVRGPGGASKPDLKQSAIRNSWTLLPIIPYIGGLLGVIAIIGIAVTIENSPTKQGKHDELAGGTQVIKT
jgi:uncharacterized RDD family membrane protein YckC